LKLKTYDAPNTFEPHYETFKKIPQFVSAQYIANLFPNNIKNVSEITSPELGLTSIRDFAQVLIQKMFQSTEKQRAQDF